jgi:hypothetical protein
MNMLLQEGEAPKQCKQEKLEAGTARRHPKNTLVQGV